MTDLTTALRRSLDGRWAHVREEARRDLEPERFAPPNRPQWTPALTMTDRSAWPSISKAVTDPPRSPLPPTSLGKPRAG